MANLRQRTRRRAGKAGRVGRAGRVHHSGRSPRRIYDKERAGEQEVTKQIRNEKRFLIRKLVSKNIITKEY